MHWQDLLLKLSGEGRLWVTLILPPLIAWHVPAPKYGKKDG